MQTGASSAAASAFALQALKGLFQTSGAAAAGQEMPGFAPTAGSGGPPPAAPPGPPPSARTGPGLTAATLSSLLDVQKDRGGDLVSKMIAAADSDGDGKLSISEISAATGVSDSASITKAFTALDANGDQSLNANELGAGLQAAQPHGRRGHHHGPPPAASDVAATLLKAADSDKGGSLSLEEIVKALGSDAGSDPSKAFAALDANGDGALASDELTRGLQAMTSRQMSAYAATAPATAAAASVSIAA